VGEGNWAAIMKVAVPAAVVVVTWFFSSRASKGRHLTSIKPSLSIVTERRDEPPIGSYLYVYVYNGGPGVARKLEYGLHIEWGGKSMGGKRDEKGTAGSLGVGDRVQVRRIHGTAGALVWGTMADYVPPVV